MFTGYHFETNKNKIIKSYVNVVAINIKVYAKLYSYKLYRSLELIYFIRNTNR